MKPTLLRAILSIALILIALTSESTSAQTSEAKKELITQLLQLQRAGIEQMARSLAEQPAALAVQNVRMHLVTRVPPERREALGKAADAEIKKYLDDAIPMLRTKAVQFAPSTVGKVLDEKFSEDELRQLIAFIDSPLNRKFQAATGDLQKALMQKLEADAKPELEPKVRALDNNLARALGLPAAGSGPAPGASAPRTPLN